MNSVKITAMTVPVGENTDGCVNAEQYMVWAARVSNPGNQSNHDTGEKLLRYCLRKKHWSVFEQVSISMEIRAPRDISRQILRHQSFRFQEFSQRYSELSGDISLREARMQDPKNRQASTECADEDLRHRWNILQGEIAQAASKYYLWAIQNGIAKECARVVLPEGLTQSVLIMTGSVRSWIHYCEVRRSVETQKEHREIADLCWEQLRKVCPIVCAAVEAEEEQR
jgi:thymidylate synthase (FAD)